MSQGTSQSQCYPTPKLVGLATVGVVLGPWGNKGEAKVLPQTDNPDRFSIGQTLLADGKPLTVEGSRWHKGFQLIKFKELDSREHIDQIYKALLEVDLEDVPPLAHDNYYHFQILDLQVYTSNREYLGVIVEILETGGNDVYVVRSTSKDILIPAITNVIVSVDLDNFEMIVDLPDGLL